MHLNLKCYGYDYFYTMKRKNPAYFYAKIKTTHQGSYNNNPPVLQGSEISQPENPMQVENPLVRETGCVYRNLASCYTPKLTKI